MVATNNLQGQINLLTERSQRTGEDFSSMINTLASQRATKIQNINNDYTKRYNAAIAAGDLELANQILAEQQQWLNTVSYPESPLTPLEQQQQARQLEYEYRFMGGINQIADYVANLTGVLINFQYNPYTDQALLMAQGQATARVKEQMNATGMYYSSMTVSAITKACAELIPVYEKMARQEILDNINALQSTANFLMNLEQSQFNLWKGQIEMQYKANEEKRKEVDAAWERANMMGYIDNAASAVLGIPAGALSPNERARIQNKLDTIDKEMRALEQDKILAKYKEGLEEDYYSYQQQNKATTSSGSNTKTVITQKPDGTYEIQETVTLDRPLTEAEREEINKSNAQVAEQPKKEYTGDMTGADLAKSVSSESAVTPQDKVNKLTYIKENAKSKAEAEKAVAQATAGSSKEEMFAKDILETAGIDGLITYYNALDNTRFMQAIEGTDGTLMDAYKLQYGNNTVNKNNVGLISILSSNAKNKDAMISRYLSEVVTPQINATVFSGNTGETQKNQKAILDVIGDYAIPLLTPTFYNARNIDHVTNMYETLADKIMATPNYDIDPAWFDEGKNAMAKGIQNIIVEIRDNYEQGKLGEGTNSRGWGNVITNLQQYAKEQNDAGKISGWDKASKDWKSF